MHSWRLVALFGSACLLLAGCAGRFASVTPTQAVAELVTGRPLLSCREPCLAAWQSAEPQAAALAAAARWRELTVLVLRVGYQDDLTLYYLGRSAEGIGYPGAAASYYRQSIQLSGTSISCRYLSRMCGGINLPHEASLRLAAIDRELSRRTRRVRRPRPAPAPGEAAEPVAGEASAPPAGEAAPAGGEAAAPAPAPTPAPPPPPPPHSSDYIEPPPIVH